MKSVLFPLVILMVLFSRSQQLLPPSLLLTKKDIVDKSTDPEETALSPEDFKNLPDLEVDLRLLGIKVNPDPTMGDKMEGDIAIPNLKNSLRKFMDIASGNSVARNSIRQPYRRWPKNEIPYTLSTQYGSYSRSIIAKAMNEYHAKTCIKFVPRDARLHRDYVYIHPDDGCYSLVGRVGGRQPLSLDSGCIQVGTVVHEFYLMHTVGFFHEQSRYDRDQFIEIVWGNVMNGADDQFERYGFNVIDQLNEPYDYTSIMHYGPYAFSSNGKRTIIARRAGAHKMGQRVAFSDVDVRKINKLYQCSTPSGGARGVESTRTSTQQTDVTTEEVPQQPCEDLNWRCMFWSLTVFPYCEKYEDIRTRICPLSCGTCHSNSGSNGNKSTAPQLSPDDLSSLCTDKSVLCARLQNPCTVPLSRWLCQRRCAKECEEDKDR